MSLGELPAELLVRVLTQLEAKELSCCDQLSRLFHGPPSLVEQALRLRSSEVGVSVPDALPSNHANWTQALLFDSVNTRSCSVLAKRKRTAPLSTPMEPLSFVALTE